MAETKLTATQAEHWRCFHCEFETSNRAEAEAHFGDGDEASEFVPICKWWASSDDDEKKRGYQDLLIELNAARAEVAPLQAEHDRVLAVMREYRQDYLCEDEDEVRIPVKYYDRLLAADKEAR